MTTRFDQDTAVQPLGDGGYGVSFSPAWWTERGANGGYIAAIAARAVIDEVGPERPLRSFTLHYLRPPQAGAAEARVCIERAGRGLTSATVRLTQDDRLLALGAAQLASAYPAVLEYDLTEPPRVPAPEQIERVDDPLATPYTENLEIRPALGSMPLSSGPVAQSGGWVRFLEPRPVDAVALVALSDAWWPAPFSLLDRVVDAPTIDLTVHLRAPLPREHDHVLVEVRSEMARDGFFEEDSRVWARDGMLLAHSRQLALLIEPA